MRPRQVEEEGLLDEEALDPPDVGVKLHLWLGEEDLVLLDEEDLALLDEEDPAPLGEEVMPHLLAEEVSWFVVDCGLFFCGCYFCSTHVPRRPAKISSKNRNFALHPSSPSPSSPLLHPPLLFKWPSLVFSNSRLIAF